MTPLNKDADGKKRTFKVTIKDSYTKLTASYDVTVKVAKLEEPEFTKDLDDKVYTVKLNQRFEETLPDVITLSDPSKIEIALEDEPSYVKLQNKNKLVINPTHVSDAGDDIDFKIVIIDKETGEDEHYSVTVKVPEIDQPAKVKPSQPPQYSQTIKTHFDLESGEVEEYTLPSIINVQ